MSLSEAAKQSISEEQSTLTKVITTLSEQRQNLSWRATDEGKRARELTAAIVNARRVEDKAMLASDEAVSHGLSQMNQDELKVLDALIQRPYFARVALIEEDEAGKSKEYEYKLGISANPDCRIVDWRKAPIAKLYYEYKEGDEYSEEIQGKDRNGKITLRNTLEIEKGILKRISCRHGNFQFKEDSWQDEKSMQPRSGSGVSGILQSILPLITAQQFKTITETANTAVLIQGVAGSGKTSVALHRLAWLLYESNSKVETTSCAVIVLSQSMHSYISGTLPSIGIEGVKVLTLRDWFKLTLKRYVPQFLNAEGNLTRPLDTPGASIERVKRSMALLKVLEAEQLKEHDLIAALLKILSDPEKILELDETKLITKDLLTATYQRTLRNIENKCLDFADDALFYRLISLREKGIYLHNGEFGKYKHLVVDEVQDFSPVDLACVIGAVENQAGLTVVGDTAQRIDESTGFPGWDKLREHWAFKESLSRFISLSVSHRSTLPIMKLADYVQRSEQVTQGRPGRTPIWFKCKNESLGVKAAIDWLTIALEKYPNESCAVVCADASQARFALSLLKPSFGGSVRLAEESNFAFGSGIVVSELRILRGLEFFNVLIWDASNQNYPNSRASRNMLYVALTRARENLSLITWTKPSECLPGIQSKLIRGIEIGLGEE